MEVKCTQCGGSVPIREHQGLADCPFCSSSLYVDVLEGVGHFIIKSILKESSIEPQLKTFLESKERKGEFTVNNRWLVYWPFWQVQDSENKVSTGIAAAHPITAIEESAYQTGAMVPYKEEEVENSTVEPPYEALNEYLERTGIEAKKALLIHAPFWQVRYTYHEIEYEVWIDAVRGRVFGDDLPPTFAKEKDKLYIRAMAIIVMVYFVIGVLFSNGDLAVFIMIVASIPLFFIVRNLVKEEVS